MLLTAKFEDIKKVAQNLVDDKILRQLVEFVYKLNNSKVVDIFDNVDITQKQTKRGSDLVKVETDTDLSLSRENMKYIPRNFNDNLKTRFESKSRDTKPEGSEEAENKKSKNVLDNKYLNDDMTTDKIENDDSSADVEKSKKNNRKGRTKIDTTFGISTVTVNKERNKFEHNNFKFKKQCNSSKPLTFKRADFSRSIYIETKKKEG